MPTAYRKSEGSPTMNATAPDSENGNENGQTGTDTNLLELAQHQYPALSELLRSAENCPECFQLWAKRLPSLLLQDWLDRWRFLGRPLLPWPTSVEAEGATSQK